MHMDKNEVKMLIFMWCCLFSCIQTPKHFSSTTQQKSLFHIIHECQWITDHAFVFVVFFFPMRDLWICGITPESRKINTLSFNVHTIFIMHISLFHFKK